MNPHSLCVIRLRVSSFCFVLSFGLLEHWGILSGILTVFALFRRRGICNTQQTNEPYTRRLAVTAGCVLATFV